MSSVNNIHDVSGAIWNFSTTPSFGIVFRDKMFFVCCYLRQRNQASKWFCCLRGNERPIPGEMIKFYHPNWSIGILVIFWTRNRALFNFNFKVYVALLFFNIAWDWCRMYMLQNCCPKQISLPWHGFKSQRAINWDWIFAWKACNFQFLWSWQNPSKLVVKEMTVDNPIIWSHRIFFWSE